MSVRLTDWVVVRNRLSQFGSRNKKWVGDGINERSRRVSVASSFAERVVHLPLSENGTHRAVARAEWYSVMDQPLQVHEIVA